MKTAILGFILWLAVLAAAFADRSYCHTDSECGCIEECLE